MGTGESKATIKIGQEGAEATGKAIRKVDEEQQQLGKTTKGQIKPTEDLTETQQKLNAAEGDYVGILGQIHPALGAVAGASINATKIAADMANKQISLRGALWKVTAAAKANIATLKLLGATGAVVAGIALVVKVYNSLRESMTRSTESLQAGDRAQQESRKGFNALRDSIQETADARIRLAGLGDDDLRAIGRQAEVLAKKYGVDKAKAGRILAETQGTGLTEDEKVGLMLGEMGGAKGAFAVEFDPGETRAQRAAGARTLLRHETFQQRIGTGVDRARSRERERARDLLDQARAGEGEDLVGALKAKGLSDEDVEEALQAARYAGGTTGGVRQALEEGRRRNLPWDEGVGLRSQSLSEGFFGQEQTMGVRENVIMDLVAVLREREDREKRAGRAAEEWRERNPPVSVGFQINNGVDARSFEARSVNGQSLRGTLIREGN